MISKFKIGFQSWFLRSNIFFVSFGGSFGKTDLGPFGVLEKLTQDLLLDSIEIFMIRSKKKS